MNKYNQLISLLGLANRARKIVSGEDLVIRDIRNGNAKLVILSEDASDNTIKKTTDKCKTFQVPYVIFGNRTILGNAIGKESRVVIAITERGFAKKWLQLLG